MHASTVRFRPGETCEWTAPHTSGDSATIVVTHEFTAGAVVVVFAQTFPSRPFRFLGIRICIQPAPECQALLERLNLREFHVTGSPHLGSFVPFGTLPAVFRRGCTNGGRASAHPAAAGSAFLGVHASAGCVPRTSAWPAPADVLVCRSYCLLFPGAVTTGVVLWAYGVP